jgi:hypothetical protein
VISKIWNPFLTPVLAEPPPPPTRICRAEICQGKNNKHCGNGSVVDLDPGRIRFRIRKKIILDSGSFESEMNLK